MAGRLIPLFGSHDQAYKKHKTQSYDLVVVEPLKNDDLGMIKRFLHITILMLWSYIKMKLYDYDAFI